MPHYRLGHTRTCAQGNDEIGATNMPAEPLDNRNPLSPKDSREVRTSFASGGVKCTARSKRTGEPCQAPAALGGNVCRAHGGNAPQTKAKAQARLAQAADVLVQRLLRFALDRDAPDAIALAAIRDALDRAGLGARQAIEIGVDPKPWENVLADLAGIAPISREESQIRRGILPTPALEVVDAEVVDAPDDASAEADPITIGLLPLDEAVGAARDRPRPPDRL